MKLKRILFITFGCLCFGLGTVGVFLPILPSTPFYLATLFFFANSSEKLHRWFLGTKLYKKHLESFVKKRGMLLKTKITIISTVTLLMGLGFFMMVRKGIWIPCVILAVVWLIHIFYFVFKVKTIEETRKDDINMKPDYKNWMPKGMVLSAVIVTAVFLLLFIIFGLTGFVSGALKTVLFIVFLVGTVIGLCVSLWMILMYRTFSYNGKRQMSRQIIEGVAEYIKLPDGGKGLDVGCGSGALAIACAKRNPNASFVGIDRWGKEYASFNKPLCENNAKAEGVTNVTFSQGDACKLDFADETFDAVTSNYVYHNIPSNDRQAILLETLRVLKKGGAFAIHDIFSRSKYGDMQEFVKKLKDMGYEKVELIDSTGKFMTKQEAKCMALDGSALLVGRK